MLQEFYTNFYTSKHYSMPIARRRVFFPLQKLRLGRRSTVDLLSYVSRQIKLGRLLFSFKNGEAGDAI
jgi:hypothetical protein